MKSHLTDFADGFIQQVAVREVLQHLRRPLDQQLPKPPGHERTGVAHSLRNQFCVVVRDVLLGRPGYRVVVLRHAHGVLERVQRARVPRAVASGGLGPREACPARVGRRVHPLPIFPCIPFFPPRTPSSPE